MELLASLDKQIRVFRTQLTATHNDPNKRNIHKLRVCVRRLRAILWLAKHSSSHLDFGKTTKLLRKLGQELGKHRELDVAIEDAHKYKVKTKKLKTKRLFITKKKKKKLTSKQRQNLIRKLQQASLQIKHQQEINVTPSLILLREKITPWLRRQQVSDKDLHQVRIITKKTRYALEAIGKPTKTLKNLQDLLGKGNDLEVLKALSGKN